MSAGELVKRELRVALSRRGQPVWFRVIKWAALLGLSAMFWRSPSFWMWLTIALGAGLAVHFIWRWKTRGWTQPWGGWDDVESADGRK
jgi:hypothetical protein